MADDRADLRQAPRPVGAPARADGRHLRPLRPARPQLRPRHDRPDRAQDHPRERVRAAHVPLVAGAAHAGAGHQGARRRGGDRGRLRGERRVPPALRERPPRRAGRRPHRRNRRDHRRAPHPAARLKLTRVPIESPAPVAWFGTLRLAIVISGILAVVVFDVPERGTLLLLSAGLALPWALAILVLVRRFPRLMLHPAVAVGDLVVLALVELAVPEAYAGVCFLVVFLVAAHAHFQGPQIGLAIAVLAVLVFVPIAAFGDPPVNGGLLAFYEVLFV